MCDLDEVKIGLYYKINGKKIEHMPCTIDELAKVEVEYLTMKGYIIYFNLIVGNQTFLDSLIFLNCLKQLKSM